VDDKGLGLKIVQKPAGRKTVYWLKTSILVLLPVIARPTGAVLDWFADPPSVCFVCSRYLQIPNLTHVLL
jgi:hypothetical protein